MLLLRVFLQAVYYDPQTRVKAIGRIIRVELLEAEHQQWYVVTQFDVIREEDREAIIRYVFREQRVALRARNVPTAPLKTNH